MCGGGAPAHVVPVAAVAYGLGFVAQQKRKVTRMLTEGSGRPEMPRRGVDGEVGRRSSELHTWTGQCRGSPGS